MPYGYISVGSNIDKDKHTPSSLTALAQRFGDLKISGTYESQAMGFEGENFYNLIVGFASEWPVKQVAKELKQIEKEHGRTHTDKKFSARTLDLDLILYGDLVVSEGRLQIPRDEITRYAFVLEPLAEIAPELRHPVTGIKYADLWLAYDKTDLRQIKIDPPWDASAV